MVARVLVVCLSVGLLAGYVWHSQKDDQDKKSTSDAANQAEEETDIKAGDDPFAPDEGVDSDDEELNRTLIFGSKSAPVFRPDLISDDLLLPDRVPVDQGNDSGDEVDDSSDVEDNTSNEPKAEDDVKRRIILPGSKSRIRLLEPKSE